MKNFTTLFLILITGSIGLSAQNTETRELNTFDQIHVATGIHATLIPGNTNKIVLTAKGIDLDKVKSQVKDGALTVKITNNKLWNWSIKKQKVEALITYASELEEISTSSGASIVSEHDIISNDLSIEASSGSKIHVDLVSDEVAIEVSSGASIKAGGRTTDLEVDISSGASFKGYDLVADNVDVDGSSGASARVNVTENLVVDVSSGSSVKYKGNPKTKDIEKSSGGSVRQSSNM